MPAFYLYTRSGFWASIYHGTRDTYYFVQWEGYGGEYSSWEMASTLTTAPMDRTQATIRWDGEADELSAYPTTTCGCWSKIDWRDQGPLPVTIADPFDASSELLQAINGVAVIMHNSALREGDQALRAQEAGAKAVVIIADEGSSSGSLSGGDGAYDLRIPTIMAHYTVGKGPMGALDANADALLEERS